MPRPTIAFDLYEFVLQLSKAVWIEKIFIFGSRRYLENTSFGSDIDLLVIPNRDTSIQTLRDVNDAIYVDAFLLNGNLATSVANETQIRVDAKNIEESLGATILWTRKKGWIKGEKYRTLSVLPDQAPPMSGEHKPGSPILIFCALPKEFKAVVKCLPKGKSVTGFSMPHYFRTHIKTKSGAQKLIVVAHVGMGSVRAAIAASRTSYSTECDSTYWGAAPDSRHESHHHNCNAYRHDRSIHKCWHWLCSQRTIFFCVSQEASGFPQMTRITGDPP